MRSCMVSSKMRLCVNSSYNSYTREAYLSCVQTTKTKTKNILHMNYKSLPQCNKVSTRTFKPKSAVLFRIYHFIWAIKPEVTGRILKALQ